MKKQSGHNMRLGRHGSGTQSTSCWRTTSHSRAQTTTTTSVKALSKRDAGESQIDFIERFDLERVIGNGNEAFVLYVGRTKNGKTFRNVEHLRLRDRKVEAIECYFGAPSSFPSAVSAG